MKQPDVDVTVFISAGVIIKDDARDIIEDVDPDFFTGREPDPHLPPEYLRAIPILVAVESFLTIAEFDAVATDTYPVLAAIVQLDVANSLGDSQTVYSYSVVETPESIVDAIETAENIFVVASGMQASSGWINPCEQIWGCWTDGTVWECPPEADISPECCDCYDDYNTCKQGCHTDFAAHVIVCLGGSALGIAGCVFGCTALLAVFAAPCINKCVAWIARAAAVCVTGALTMYAACHLSCLMTKNQCLADNNCD